MDIRYSYTYDGHGNSLTEDSDVNVDGVTDIRRTSTYDDEGNKLTEEVDITMDGMTDSRTLYTYDGAGNRLTETTEQLNRDSAVLGSRVTYDYSCQ